MTKKVLNRSLRAAKATKQDEFDTELAVEKKARAGSVKYLNTAKSGKNDEFYTKLDDPMSIVEEHTAEAFVLARAQLQRQVVAHRLGRRDCVAATDAARDMLACSREDFLCRRGNRNPGGIEREQGLQAQHSASP
jgi:hypothetical protein